VAQGRVIAHPESSGYFVGNSGLDTLRRMRSAAKQLAAGEGRAQIVAEFDVTYCRPARSAPCQ